MLCGNYTEISPRFISSPGYFGENATGNGEKSQLQRKRAREHMRKHVYAYLCVIDFIRVSSPHTVCMIQILLSSQAMNLISSFALIQQIPNRTWYLAQFKHFLVHNFGAEAAEIAFQNMEAAIAETLLVAESSLAAHFGAFTTHPWEDHYR